jgi:hypothetical protein
MIILNIAYLSYDYFEYSLFKLCLYEMLSVMYVLLPFL